MWASSKTITSTILVCSPRWTAFANNSSSRNKTNSLRWIVLVLVGKYPNLRALLDNPHHRSGLRLCMVAKYHSWNLQPCQKGCLKIGINKTKYDCAAVQWIACPPKHTSTWKRLNTELQKNEAFLLETAKLFDIFWRWWSPFLQNKVKIVWLFASRLAGNSRYCSSELFIFFCLLQEKCRNGLLKSICRKTLEIINTWSLKNSYQHESSTLSQENDLIENEFKSEMKLNEKALSFNKASESRWQSASRSQFVQIN